MLQSEFNEWYRTNGKGREQVHANGITHTFALLDDGWIAIFQNIEGRYVPCVQAIDREHAISYCTLKEPGPICGLTLLIK